MRKKIALVVASVLAGVAAHASAGVITQWSFSSTVAAPDNNPAPSTDVTGTATATQLGMTNSYTYTMGEGPGSTAACDVASTKGTAVSTFTENLWRIRGNSNATNAGPGMANGWNNSAPNYTQGAEFMVNTTGFQNIGLSFDWYCTTSGVANLQVRYTTDGVNFTNLGSDLIATSNDYYGGGGTSPTNTFDLSGIPGVNNNPHFAIELVSVKPVLGDSNYQTLGPGGDGNYAQASGGTGAAGDYNNNSGNWRFGNITITGTAVATPEPASAGALGLCGLALLARRRARRQ